jgi:hypothetical protein
VHRAASTEQMNRQNRLDFQLRVFIDNLVVLRVNSLD